MDILKKEICFLSKDKIYCTIGDEKYSKELILSPYYYWYFEKKLPVSNTKRAKAIVSQMLETSLPLDKKFQFILRQKEKNIFDVFALDYELLVSKLNILGIEKEMVSSIAFSNIELEDSLIELDNSIILSYEGSVSEIQKKETVESHLLKIDIKSFLEKKQKTFFRYRFSKGNAVQKTLDFMESNFLSIAVVLVFFLSSFMIDIVSTNSVVNEYEQKKEQVFKTQSYATHSVQLKYVMDEVLQLDFKQKNLKKEMQQIIKINANKNSYIKKLEYDDGDWFLSVVAQDKDNADKLLKNKKYTFVGTEKNIFKYEKIK